MVTEIAQEVCNEMRRAMTLHAPMASAHEGYAVLLEEFDELKLHVWMNENKRDLPAMRKEAIQLAAMAMRFVFDVIDGGRGRK